MPWLAAIAAISGGVAGAVGSADQRGAAKDAAQQAAQQYLQLQVPDPVEQQLILEKYQNTGQMDPRLEKAITIAQSEQAQIRPDAGLQGTQLRALDQLQQEGLTGGLTLQDQATLQQQINDSNSAARGRAASIQDDFQKRGMGGSGLDLVAQLQNAQNANQTQATNSLNAAAAARQRALSAIAQSGSLAGQMDANQFNQKSQAAQAQDALNKFNTHNMQNVANRNVDLLNQAQLYNVQNQQNVSNKNTDLSNYQQQYNKNLRQLQFQNQYQKAQGSANALNNLATNNQNQANDTAGMYAGIGAGLGKAGAAYYQYQNQNGNNNQWADGVNDDTNKNAQNGWSVSGGY